MITRYLVTAVFDDLPPTARMRARITARDIGTAIELGREALTAQLGREPRSIWVQRATKSPVGPTHCHACRAVLDPKRRGAYDLARGLAYCGRCAP